MATRRKRRIVLNFTPPHKKRKIEIESPEIQITYDMDTVLSDAVLKANNYKILKELNDEQLTLQCISRGIIGPNWYKYKLRDFRRYIDKKGKNNDKFEDDLPVVLMLYNDKKTKTQIFNGYLTYWDIRPQKMIKISQNVGLYMVFGFNDNYCGTLDESQEMIEYINNCIDTEFNKTIKKGRLKSKQFFPWSTVADLIMFYIISEFYYYYKNIMWNVFRETNYISLDVRRIIFEYSFHNIKWYNNNNNNYIDKSKLIYLFYMHYNDVPYIWKNWIRNNVSIPNKQKEIIYNYFKITQLNAKRALPINSEIIKLFDPQS